MKYLKAFENYNEGESLSPKEFAQKWNPDYKFIVYVNGKPTSGWEYLGDALRDGIAESHLGLSHEDMFDFEDNMDMALGANNISADDEYYEVDEDLLNDSLYQLLENYDFDGTIQIRLVDGVNESVDEGEEELFKN